MDLSSLIHAGMDLSCCATGVQGDGLGAEDSQRGELGGVARCGYHLVPVGECCFGDGVAKAGCVQPVISQMAIFMEALG